MSAQIIQPSKPLPDPTGRPTNLFDYLHTNPYQISDSKSAFIRAADGKALSRGQLRTDAKRLAHVYIHKLGLKPGQRIAIFSPNSTIYPIAVHAGLCSTVVLVPMNPGYSAEELVHPLKDSQVEFVLAHPSVLSTARKGLELAGISSKTQNGIDRILLLTDDDEVKSGPNGEKDVRSLMGKEELKSREIKDPAEIDAFISYSSGTSGLPKGVQLTHLNLIAVTHAIDAGLGSDFTKDDVHLGVLPFQHIFANTKFLSHAVFAGVPVVVLPKFDLDAWCNAVQRYKVTIGIVVPPILVLIAKSPVVEKYDLSSLKFFMSGAAPLSAELGDQVEKRFPSVRITQGYGLTETSPTATYTLYKNYRSVKGSCGALLPGVEARLVDDDGKDVGHEQGKEGKAGELWLRGPTVINRKKGYLNLPKVNEECITEDSWFKTGDVAVYRNGYFYITDRKKELIKYKGNQVAPAELEALLLQNQKVADCAVLGIYDDSEATEFPRAYVVPTESAGIKDEASKKTFEKEVQDWVNKQVANHKKLRGGVRVIEVIPKSPSGKILRRILRDQQAQEAKNSSSSSPKAKL